MPSKHKVALGLGAYSVLQAKVHHFQVFVFFKPILWSLKYLLFGSQFVLIHVDFVFQVLLLHVLVLFLHDEKRGVYTWLILGYVGYVCKHF